MKKITDYWIKKWEPCCKALEWWDGERDALKVLRKLMKCKKYDWANWMIVRLMKYKQYVSYAVFAAEQAIDIFEKEHPDDDRPRKAIEVAKKCVKKKSYATGTACAAYRAAYYATDTTYAAYYAYRAAYYAAYAACAATDTACADYYAYYAAAYAAYAAACREKMQRKILNYGINLLKEGVK